MFSFLPGIGQVLVFLSGTKWIYKLLRNFGVLKKVFLNVETVAKAMISRHDPTPNCQEVKLLLEALELVFRNELIDIPGVDEVEISRVLANVEANLICEVNQGGFNANDSGGPKNGI